MGLGGYPDVSLAEARKKATEARQLLRTGVDPIKVRQAETEKMPTFTTCAARYIRAHRQDWKNAKHARQRVSTLKTYTRPKIGSKPVDTIGTNDVLAILAPIWTTKTETTKHLQRCLESILDYAAAHGYRDLVNPARWRGHLDKLLPRPAKK